MNGHLGLIHSILPATVDLNVKIPVFGRRVEREIAKGLTETFDTEAHLIEQYLR